MEWIWRREGAREDFTAHVMYIFDHLIFSQSSANLIFKVNLKIIHYK